MKTAAARSGGVVVAVVDTSKKKKKKKNGHQHPQQQHSHSRLARTSTYQSAQHTHSSLLNPPLAFILLAASFLLLSSCADSFFLPSPSSPYRNPRNGIRHQSPATMTFTNPSSPKRLKVSNPTGSTLTASSSSLEAAATTAANARKELQQLAQEMDDRASSTTPFTTRELEELETSFRSIMNPVSSSSSSSSSSKGAVVVEEKDIQEMTNKLHDLLFTKVGHLSHKDWERTGQSATTLREILLPKDDGLTEEFKHMFDRVIKEGNWDNAITYAKEHFKDGEKDSKPWAVLVTGVNGIRKTTSVYQSWFPELLEEALIAPSSPTGDDSSATSPSSMLLPNGNNSFFRQLDHMIATISNYNFQLLYKLTSQSHDFATTTTTTKTTTNNEKNIPSKDVIQNYSNYKASIFKRYRTLSEILGVMLIRQAMDQNINVMIETSGRDVAMFHYIDSFFPTEKYNKLVLHFTINDLSHAEGSVDRRMISEMEDGVKVLGFKNNSNGDDNASSSSNCSSNNGEINVRDLINVNAGGPYGSEVLKGIQTDSDAVWETILKNSNSAEKEVGHDWYKASIEIEASADRDWTAKAILPDGSNGKVFTFEAPRKV